MTAVKPVNGLNGFHKHDHEDIEAPGMRRVVSTGALEKMGMRITFQVLGRKAHPLPHTLNSST
jgi:hypothetical protein